ncbi:MAG TPA: phosphoribosylaminoimidazolesuccinocarboxamide synthase, partial [Dehalococcoidia bacterium]|nr:phosphoribosylaminoimidazolesuccinocarboxamide synthase [Dehalococcoidia bacterium]
DEEVIAMVGADLARRLEDVTKAVFQFGHDFAHERGVILADTKMEFG